MKFISKNGVNIKIIDENLCCIYGNEESSNYFMTKEDLEKIIKIMNEVK